VAHDEIPYESGDSNDIYAPLKAVCKTKYKSRRFANENKNLFLERYVYCNSKD